MKKSKVKKTGHNGFIKVLTILLVVFVIWIVLAMNSGKISNLWAKNADNDITGEATATSCEWGGKPYPLDSIFWNDGKKVKPAGCRYCASSGSSVSLASCQQAYANGNCRVFWGRDIGGTNFVGTNNTIGFSSAPNDARFLCLNNRFYECGWELTDATLAVEKANGDVIGAYKCDLANKKWVSNAAPTPSSYNCLKTVPQTGVIKGPSSASSPLNWTYDISATTLTPCKWKCDSGYEVNSSLTGCSLIETPAPTPSSYNCLKTVPQTGVIKGPSSASSPLNWTYDISATASTPCLWKCASDYEVNSSLTGCSLIENCSALPGCKNASISIANSNNISGTCSQQGYSCYSCNSGYSWNSNTGECRLSLTESTWSKVTIVESATAEAGYKGALAVNEVFKIIVLDEYHYVALVKINSSSAVINVSSTPQQKVFSIGSEQKFDLNGDGVFDLTVKLNSMTSNQANITLWVLEQETGPSEETDETSATDERAQTTTPRTQTSGQTYEDTSTGEEESAKTGSSSFVWILVIMVIAVLIAIIFVYLKKTGKLDKILKKDKSEKGMPPSAMFPRPGFPPKPGMPPAAPQGLIPQRPGMPSNMPAVFHPTMPPRPGMPPMKPIIPPAARPAEKK